MGLTARCCTPGCTEIEHLETMEGGEGEVCPACRAEIRLLVEQVRKDATARDAENANRRIEA